MRQKPRGYCRLKETNYTPPTRSRGIHIYTYISYFTVLYHHTHISLSSIYRTKSRTSFLFFLLHPPTRLSFLFLSLFHRQQRLARSANALHRTTPLPFPPVLFCQSPDEWEILYIRPRDVYTLISFREKREKRERERKNDATTLLSDFSIDLIPGGGRRKSNHRTLWRFNTGM